MAENNSFLQDMMGKGRPAQTAAASEPVSNRPTPKTKASNSYDVQSYGLLKLRLNDQRTQVKAMSDYSEDSAIKLNDIYEILKSMKSTSYVSSLDTYFSDNGYIPVKVLNPCCEENNSPVNTAPGLGNDLLDIGKLAKKLWPFLRVFALPLIGSMIMGGGAEIPDYYERKDANKEAEELANKKDFEGAAKIIDDFAKSSNTAPGGSLWSPYTKDDPRFWREKYLEDRGVNDLTDEIQNKAAERKANNEVMGIGNRDRQDRNVSYENDIKVLSDQINELLKGNKKPQQTQKNPDQTFSDKKFDSTNINPATMSSPFSVGDVTSYGKKFNNADNSTTTLKPEKVSSNVSTVSSKSDIILASYGIEKDNTDNTILSGRKINFVAKEITYEAGKFEFIDQTGVSASSGVTGGNGVSLASYTPPGAFAPGTGNVTTYNMPSRRDGATNSYQVPATHDQMSAKESAVIDMISKREGVSGEQGYDMILGDVNGPGTSLLGVPPKPLTEMTLNELYDWQTQMLNNPNNRWNSSAAGAGQFVRTTLFGKNRSGGLLAQMGITPDLWGTTKFDKTLQDMLILQNFKDNVGDPTADPSTWNMTALGAQWQSFMFKPLNQNDVNALRGVTAQTNKPSNLGPHADITSKSASTAMQLNTPVKTTAPAVVRPSVINVSSPAYSKVDEPMAAWDDMFDRLLDQTLMFNV
jgi:hypothetical protein